MRHTDMRVVALALRYDITVATVDTGFQRSDRLRVEIWTWQQTGDMAQAMSPAAMRRYPLIYGAG
jgi:hypothetical protein